MWMRCLKNWSVTPFQHLQRGTGRHYSWEKTSGFFFMGSLHSRTLLGLLWNTSRAAGFQFSETGEGQKWSDWMKMERRGGMRGDERSQWPGGADWQIWKLSQGGRQRYQLFLDFLFVFTLQKEREWGLIKHLSFQESSLMSLTLKW